MGLSMDLFILQLAPETFNEHELCSSTLAINAELSRAGMKVIRKCWSVDDVKLLHVKSVILNGRKEPEIKNEAQFTSTIPKATVDVS